LQRVTVPSYRNAQAAAGDLLSYDGWNADGSSRIRGAGIGSSPTGLRQLLRVGGQSAAQRFLDVRPPQVSWREPANGC